MKHLGAVTEVVYHDQNIEQFLVALLLLHRDDQLVLVLDDLVDCAVVKGIKEALFTVVYTHIDPDECFHRVPHGVYINRWAEYKHPLKTRFAAPVGVMPQDEVD